MILANGVFEDLSLMVRRKIAELQRHILTQERNFRPKWPEANRLVKEIAGEINGTVGIKRLPVDLDSVARHLHVRLQPQPRAEFESLGELCPIPGGFRVAIFGQIDERKLENYRLPLLDSFSQAEKQRAEVVANLSPQGRFTFAHELGHALFYTSDQPGSKPERLIPVNCGTTKGNWREDGLCHDFARVLLMPDKYSSIVKESATASELLAATQAFNISIEPAVRRILYDWKRWRSCMTVNVDFTKKIPTVRCFRGADRKRENAAAPTSTQLAEWLEGTDSPSEAAARFRQRFHIDEQKLICRRKNLWVLL